MKISHKCPFRTMTVNEQGMMQLGNEVSSYVKVSEQRFGTCQESCAAFLGMREVEGAVRINCARMAK